MINHLLYITMFCALLHMSTAHAELHDPTYPSDNTNQPLPEQALALKAIIMSTDRQIAIINNQTVKAGNSISSFKVIEVKTNAVVLDGPQGQITLFLNNPFIKQVTQDYSKTGHI